MTSRRKFNNHQTSSQGRHDSMVSYPNKRENEVIFAEVIRLTERGSRKSVATKRSAGLTGPTHLSQRRQKFPSLKAGPIRQLALVKLLALAMVPLAQAQPDPTSFPAYIQLQRPVLINADLWENSARIMAANYGFEGIIGIPQYFSAADLPLAAEAGSGLNMDWAGLDPVPPLRNLASAAGVLGSASAGFGAYPLYADAMPIEVSWPLLPGTVHPENIAITLNTGETVNPVAAALNPNYDHNERHVIVVFGQFGNRLTPGTQGAIYPVTVSFVRGTADMMAVGPNGPVSVTGLSSSSSNPYVAGPALVGAKLNRFSPVGDSPPPALNSAYPNDGYTLYGEDAQYRLRLYTSGGFSPDGVSGFLPTDFDQAFKLHAVDQNGNEVVITRSGVTYDLGVGKVEVVGLAEVGGPLDSPIVPGQPDRAYYVEDHDNYFDIILKGDEAAIRLLQSVEIPTSQEAGYMDIYNPGGPGRTPVPGYVYTKPALAQTFAVDLSLDEDRTVSYADQNLNRYDQDDDLPVVLRLRDANGNETLTPSSILATSLIDDGQDLVDIPFANEPDRPGVSDVNAYLNQETGTRIYTLDASEQAALDDNPAWQAEGRIFGAFDRAWPGADAFYRFYDASTGQYFFNGNLNAVLQDPALGYQGIGWYAAQFVAQPADLSFSRNDSLVLTNFINARSKLLTQGSGQLTLAAGGYFEGGVEVVNGRLIVNGPLSGGPVIVHTGGTLGGTGAIAGASRIEGRLAPGGSPGTLTFLAPVTMTTGSTLEVEVDGPATGSGPGSYARAVVLGSGNTFTAAGTVDVRLRGITPPANNNFTPTIGQQFAGVVTAQGGILGSFDGMQQPGAGLPPGTRMDLLYNPQSIDLVVTPASYGNLGAAGITASPNENAVGAALDSFRPAAGIRPTGAAAEFFPALATLAGDQIPGALNSLSGEIYASVQSPIIENSTFVRNALLDRMRGAFNGVAASALAAQSYGQSTAGPGNVGAGASAVPGAVPGAQAATGWTQVFGSWGQYGSNGNATGLDADTRGLFVGVDAPLGNTWRLGLTGGYSRTSINLDSGNGTADVDAYSLGLYGGAQWNAVGLRLGATYGWHNVSTARTAAFTGFSNSLSASYQARSVQLFGEAGYQIDLQPARLELFAGLAYVNLNTPDFVESGGIAALNVKGTDSNITFSTLGVRGDTAFTIGKTHATLRGTLGWRHAFGDVTPSSTNALMTGSAFSVSGVPIARNSAILSAGLDIQISQQATLGIYYEGQFGGGNQQNGINANLSVRF